MCSLCCIIVIDKILKGRERKRKVGGEKKKERRVGRKKKEEIEKEKICIRKRKREREGKREKERAEKIKVIGLGKKLREDLTLLRRQQFSLSGRGNDLYEVLL